MKYISQLMLTAIFVFSFMLAVAMEGATLVDAKGLSTTLFDSPIDNDGDDGDDDDGPSQPADDGDEGPPPPAKEDDGEPPQPDNDDEDERRYPPVDDGDEERSQPPDNTDNNAPSEPTDDEGNYDPWQPADDVDNAEPSESAGSIGDDEVPSPPADKGEVADKVEKSPPFINSPATGAQTQAPAANDTNQARGDLSEDTQPTPAGTTEGAVHDPAVPNPSNIGSIPDEIVPISMTSPNFFQSIWKIVEEKGFLFVKLTSQ